MLAMKPELQDSETFLRYHAIWKNNPSSVIFAPLAEMLIMHHCFEEAINVCKKGLQENPTLVSGRIALARAYVHVLNFSRASEEAKSVLDLYPEHPEALEIFEHSVSKVKGPLERVERDAALPVQKVASHAVGDTLEPSRLDPTRDLRWNTVTMADIYTTQGNYSVARRIYEQLLEKEPENSRALNGLNKLKGILSGSA